MRRVGVLAFRGRWVGMSIFVLALSITFVRLGFWQLERRAERAEQNQVYAARLASAPEDLSTILASVGTDITSLEFRPARAAGVFRPDLEVLVRNRTNGIGTAGFHVLTPFELVDGSLLIVNRGWVPLDSDSVPVTDYPPPAGRLELSGVMRLSELRTLGPIDPEGDIEVFSRVDLGRLANRYDESIAPVWLQMLSDDERGLPEELMLPEVDDPGPHLSYAIQ